MAGFGSLGGLGGSDNFGNVMQALGMSLMGSPRNAPLTNFGPMLQGLQQTSMERRASEEQRAAWEQALIGAGIDPAMAKTFAANPQAAKFQLEEQRTGQTRDFLAKNDPELAAIVDAGMPANDAFAIYAKKKMEGSQRQGLMNTGEGIYDPNTGQWIMPPDAGKSSEYTLREQAAQQQGLQPGTREYQNFVLTGKMATEEDRGLSATESKEVWQSEDEIPSLDYTIESLNRAEELNDKTFTGWGAETAGRLGTQAPGGALIFNQEKAKATNEFSKLMSMEAIQAMAATLKGATTDAELARFVDILADPSTDPQIRGSTIKRMKSLAENRRRIKLRRIQEIKGQSMPEAGAPPPGARRTSTGVDWSM